MKSVAIELGGGVRERLAKRGTEGVEYKNMTTRQKWT